MSRHISIVVTRHPEDRIMQDFYVAVDQLAWAEGLAIDLVIVNSLVDEASGSLPEFSAPGVVVRMLQAGKEAGQSGAIIQGMKQTQSESILSIDPDMGESLAAVAAMLVAMEEGSDVVIARRIFSAGRKWWRTPSSWFFNVLVSLILGFRVHDFNSPMFLLRKSVIAQLAGSQLPPEAYKFRLFMEFRNSLRELEVRDDSARYQVESTYRFPVLAGLFVRRLWLGLRLRAGL